MTPKFDAYVKCPKCLEIQQLTYVAWIKLKEGQVVLLGCCGVTITSSEIVPNPNPKPTESND